MARFESSSFRFLLWSLILPAIMGFAVQKTPAKKSFKILARTSAADNSLYEQYTLGQIEDGSKIIYTYQQDKNYDETQEEISLDFNYPNANESDSNETESSTIITQVQLFVQVKNGGNTQAYIRGGGVGENNISLKIVASNTNFLNYILVIYGRSA